MDVILGIDLGTTNSEVAVVIDGRPVVLGEPGDVILPSVVGLDPTGKLLVGRPARNQYVLAPERTIKSIKRKMGQDVTVPLGDQSYSPPEISALILRALKARAEAQLGHEVRKAVITVPAFFRDSQREATRRAGELAGLDVVRIINEPTAAVLTYEHRQAEREIVLVYDLGGGTFDVSIAQMESGVVEILASHGDTQLGGDDFDQLLADYLCDAFREEHGVDLRESAVSRSRVWHAAEEAKKRLSSEPFVEVIEEFIAERNGVPLNLKIEVAREQYEALIQPLVAKTLACVAEAMSDAKLMAPEISKVLLVGGATRTPLVRQALAEQLGRPVHSEIEPDLAVAMGAAVQGALIAGIDVGPVLVDITPHTLGIATLGYDQEGEHGLRFSPIIDRNTPLPVSRTEAYSTCYDGQREVLVSVFQGESIDVRENTSVGEFLIGGLADVPSPNEILVRLDLDLNGILRVTASEKRTGLTKQLVVDNMAAKLSKRQRVDSKDRLDSLFGQLDLGSATPIPAEFDASVAGEGDARGRAAPDRDPRDADLPPQVAQAVQLARQLLKKAEQLEKRAAAEDASEMRGLAVDLNRAIDARDPAAMQRISDELADLMFYVQDS